MARNSTSQSARRTRRHGLAFKGPVRNGSSNGKMKRGRPTKLSARVTKRIVAHPEKAWTKKPPVRWRKFLTPRSTNGKHVGKPVKNPFASFFSVISRTRDCHKARRLKLCSMRQKACCHLTLIGKRQAGYLKKGLPLEYGDRRPPPIPPAEPTPINIPIVRHSA